MHFNQKWVHNSRDTLSTYQSWIDMRKRCRDVNNKQFHDYGGRGIKICAQWIYNYDQFYEDMGPRPKGMTLDRINNEGNYEPGNCQWATRLEQTRNARSNRYLEYNGKRQRITEWAAELGISVPSLHERLTKNYTEAEIFHKGPLLHLMQPNIAAKMQKLLQYDL